MYDQDNIFARIIRNELPCVKIYEDESVLAIKDISPSAPVHILVLPKDEYISLDDFVLKASSSEVANFFTKVREIASTQLALKEHGYRIVMNHGKDAEQTVPHFHVHILGGRRLGSVA